jgi:UDP-N-acetylmuramate dehydrogenase
VQIQSNFSLQKLNSFGFLSYAEYFVSVENELELSNAIEFANQKKIPWQVLGSGSNVVLQESLPGLTIHMSILGKKLVSESATHFYIDCGAGENWHDFVRWTVEEGYPGLENLALIPGTTGAAPIQNIGAYGAEAASMIDSVEVLDTKSLLSSQSIPESERNPSPNWQVIPKADCQFAYRDSIFKRDLQAYVVTQVRFAIPKKWQANLSYAELANYFLDNKSPSAQEIFDAVVTIRSKKLPDPTLLGNAGSFFHNPIVDLATYTQLKEKFTGLVSYPAPELLGEKQFKLAAGWLIDQCGLKGYRVGDCGVYEKQALVLVNYGTAKGSEMLELANHIKQTVLEKFGVLLSQEPINLPTSNI